MENESNGKAVREAACQVNDESLLYLREDGQGCRFEAFDKSTKEMIGEGSILPEEARDAVRRGLLAYREAALERLGMDVWKVAPVSVNMLSKFQGADAYRRRLFEPDSLPKKDVRFINSRYDEQFRIPDGGSIFVEFPDRACSMVCRGIDDYHASIGGEVFHVCQFAEILEARGAKCEPEPELATSEMGWKLGSGRYLTLKECGEGWEFRAYDDNFRETASGTLERPDLGIVEAKNAVIIEQKMTGRSMTLVGYEHVERAARERAEGDRPKESVLGKLEGLRAGAASRGGGPQKKHLEEER